MKAKSRMGLDRIIRQRLRDKYPEGVVFTADRDLGACASGCTAAIHVTYNAVRYGAKFYLQGCDPKKAERTTTCALCHAEFPESEGGRYCETCYPSAMAMLGFLRRLQSIFAPLAPLKLRRTLPTSIPSKRDQWRERWG